MCVIVTDQLGPTDFLKLHKKISVTSCVFMRVVLPVAVQFTVKSGC